MSDLDEYWLSVLSNTIPPHLQMDSGGDSNMAATKALESTEIRQNNNNNNIVMAADGDDDDFKQFFDDVVNCGASESDGNAASDECDRAETTKQILAVAHKYLGIAIDLEDWARIFIEDEPEMLTRNSKIVWAHPDQQSMLAEFERGVFAVCRIVSDARLGELYAWTCELEGEWIEAAETGSKAQYGQFIDLMYSEATAIMENGKGELRNDEDMEIVSEVFGFIKKGIGAADADMAE